MYWLGAQRVPRTTVAVVFGGGSSEAATVALAAARTALTALQTRPQPEQAARLLDMLPLEARS